METKILVYADKLDEVLKSLARLSRKAELYDSHFYYEVGEAQKKWVRIGNVDYVTQTIAYNDGFYADAVEITITLDTIRKDGWEVLAKLEKIPDAEMNYVIPFTTYFDEAWMTMTDFHCDHCGTGHERKYIYILRNTENGMLYQVGRSCLKDYTGINPLGLIEWAEVHDLVEDYEVRGEWTGACASIQRYFLAETIIALSCDLVKEKGYKKSDEPGSNKSTLCNMVENHTEPSEEGTQKAKGIIQWLSEGTFGRDSFLQDCKALTVGRFVKETHLGYMAYLPVAYEKYLEREAEREAQRRAEETSQYMGEVGKRIEVKISSSKVITSWESSYNGGYSTTTTYLYKIIDESGNIYMWKTSNHLMAWKRVRKINMHTGEEFMRDVCVPATILRGTVKAHTEYNGVKQTELTRCKVVA